MKAKAAQALLEAVTAYLATIKGGGLGRRPTTHKDWKKPIGEAFGITKVYQKRMDEVVDYCIEKKMLEIIEKNGKQYFSIPDSPNESPAQEFEDEEIEDDIFEDDGVLVWVRFWWQEEGSWIPRSRVARFKKDARQAKAKAYIEAGIEETICTVCGSHTMDVYLDSRGFYACGSCNDLLPPKEPPQDSKAHSDEVESQKKIVSEVSDEILDKTGLGMFKAS